ncbi:carbohydrate binding domain-containing protein [Coraliomargarita algicola]|uniref:Carbohydrate binding domain-containing protein n=1 Tax=Coraliomargarita algicola TaxID=3092156 RepID=A0ABZ0RQC5_9BACT|nr:carbohydrate binding domain-containing protein [Coraliomargarita sp. J2-16]WPJ97348.1 carbohydrate binding domain-containing protein [Coraliomargarita sp. J2-16]
MLVLQSEASDSGSRIGSGFSGQALGSVEVGVRGAPSLPNPVAFARGEEMQRMDARLDISSFPGKGGDAGTQIYEQPVFTVGNKMVCVRKIDGRDLADKEEYVSIYIDGKEVGRFSFWGSYQGNSGYPFEAIEGDPETLEVDKAADLVRYTKPYLTPAGRRALFTYTLRSLGNSQLELAWDLGVSEAEMQASSVPFGVALWFVIDGIVREQEIRFGDEVLEHAPLHELLQGKVSTDVAGDFHYAPGQPAGSYSVLLGGRTGVVTESVFIDDLDRERYGWILRVRNQVAESSGQVVIDLEEGQLPQANVPAPLMGHDFWKIDGIHVPASPVRNLMPNPSFEQGLRHWQWTHGGAYYTPGEGPRFEAVAAGLFGPTALRLNDRQLRSSALRSFPMPLEVGKTYTLSFYAKADRACELNVALGSAARGGKFQGRYGLVFGDNDSPDAKFQIGTEWERYSRTFTADGAGVQVILSGRFNTLLDGLQLEEGDTASEFVSAPLDGWLLTSDPDNDLVKGNPIQGAFRFVGEPGTSGQVEISLKNAFREVIYEDSFSVSVPEGGMLTLPLPLDAQAMGEGVFVVRADYQVEGYEPYTHYYRLSVMRPLSNTHATKDVFGALVGHIRTLGRGEDLARKFMEWGFGSTSWGITTSPEDFEVRAPMEKKYRIANYFAPTRFLYGSQHQQLKEFKYWTEVSPELEALIEEEAYQKVKLYDPEQYYTWSMGNEEESSPLVGNGRFDEYFKAQSAAGRGVKRANPNAIFAPTNGTSGYNRLRGYDAIEGYLKASVDHGFEYDAVAVHPYGSADKGTLSTSDLDEETARLIEQMARYGYGEETPIYYTEMFNIPETLFPAWGAGPAYDHYSAGKLSYDFGNREFIQAATAARVWTIVLKYWPRVQSTNLWVGRPFLDYYFAPTLFAKAANTMGHHFAEVEYVADIKPAAGVRGYSFKRPDGSAIAALWCVDHDVENGLKQGPVMELSFDQDVELFDFMGNPRSAVADSQGRVSIPLTPAPLFIEAADVVSLTQSLQNGELNDATSALAVALTPSLEGPIYVDVKNLTGRPQAGVVTVAGQLLNYELAGEEVARIEIPEQATPVEFGKMYSWRDSYTVQPAKGKGVRGDWDMEYFYVPKTHGMPDWSNGTCN